MQMNKLKKTLAGFMSAAMMVTSVPAVNVFQSAAANEKENDYAQALALSLYFFDANACGSGITDGPLTWRGDCHLNDASIRVNDSSVEKAIRQETVDLSGGFHDAGDFIKFNLTIGFSMSSLALSYYLNEGVYENAGCTDHLKYELRKGSDYLMKSTFLDENGDVAAIAHVVANGDEDHGKWSSPELQDYDRPAYWLTASNNNSVVCFEMASALAGTAYVNKHCGDPLYAERCIDYAKKLVEFGQRFTGNNQDGIGGFYTTDSDYNDELAMAQAWLYLNGEIDGSSLTYKANSEGNYTTSSGSVLYDNWYYTWDKVWQGYSAMMYKVTGNSNYRAALERALDGVNGRLSTSYYNAPQQWGASRYNCALQMVHYALAEGDPTSEYAVAGKYQMDCILGNNPQKQSYLIGYGDDYTKRVHHRAANPNVKAGELEAPYTAYGMLIGGVDSNGNYDDYNVENAYNFTEGALDYNGCFALAAAGLANIYGGHGNEVVEITRPANEINDHFVFEEHKHNDMDFDGKCDVCSALTIEEINFPSQPFRVLLRERGDKNHDEVLDFDEIRDLTALDINNNSIIENLTGIQLLTSLKTLNVRDSFLDNIDLSGMESLQDVSIVNCGLRDIRVDGCTNLASLILNNNELTEFYGVGLGSLRLLELNNNQLVAFEANCTPVGANCYIEDNSRYIGNIPCTNEITLPDEVDINRIEYVNNGYIKDGKLYADKDADSVSYVYNSGNNNRPEFTLTFEKDEHSFGDICSKCGKVTNGLCAHLAGYKVTLDGTVGVKFYMALDDDVLAKAKANNNTTFMYFYLPDLNGAASSEFNEKNVEVIDGVSYYTFRFTLPAKNMTSEITTTFHCDGVVSEEYKFTIKEYANYILNSPEKFDEETIDVVKALLTYGTCAQRYFDYKTDNLAADELLYGFEELGIKDNSSVEGKVEGIKYVGTSLSLKAVPVLRHYFKVSENADIKDFTFSEIHPDYGSNYKPYVYEYGDGYYYLETTTGLPDTYDIKDQIFINGDEFKLSISVYDYIAKGLNSDQDTALKNTLKSLFYFGEAVKRYQRSLPADSNPG